MPRKSPRMKHNSTHRSHEAEQFDALQSIREIQDRVTRLEKALAGRLETGNTDAIPEDNRKRPGPKGVHIWSLYSDRDQLVRMLEQYWPEIRPFCIRPKAAHLKAILSAISKADHGRHELSAKHLLKHLPDVVNFVSGDRFRDDPRQIANAFAGFPQIGIWRSLKLCQANACMDPIGDRAIRAYIRRKHRTLFRYLSEDYSLINFVRALKRYRSTDSKLNMYGAAALYECWNQGIPAYEQLLHDRRR